MRIFRDRIARQRQRVSEEPPNLYVLAADHGHLVSILGWGIQGPAPWQNCVLYPGNFDANAIVGLFAPTTSRCTDNTG